MDKETHHSFMKLALALSMSSSADGKNEQAAGKDTDTDVFSCLCGKYAQAGRIELV